MMVSLLVDTSITAVVKVYTSIASGEVVIIALIVVYTNAISIGRASQMSLIERYIRVFVVYALRPKFSSIVTYNSG